ncbi:MAG: GAF domain-containing protein [Candidatus Hodarchaeota archaeon]
MNNKRTLFKTLIREALDIINDETSQNEKLKRICILLKDNVPYYDWVGFYLVDKERERELVLGPFEGEPTEHLRIPFGRGICGQAAEMEKTFLVQDVTKESNYLSCSPKVKSEIVVPISKSGKIVGEIDIDSHSLSPFTKEDQDFLEKLSGLVSSVF